MFMMPFDECLLGDAEIYFVLLLHPSNLRMTDASHLSRYKYANNYPLYDFVYVTSVY